MNRISPRVLVSATALATALATVLPLTGALPSAPAAAAVSLTCGSGGATYTLDSAGKLNRADMPDPATGNALPAGTTIDTTWTGYGHMFAGPSATFYGIKSDGLYYSHRVSSSSTWDVHHRKISPSFTAFTAADRKDDITIDRGGYIWTLSGATNDLRWYRYDAAADQFVQGSGKIVDKGWNYDAIYAADRGVIYGRDATDGKLYRSRYDYTSQRWIERHVPESFADWSDTKFMPSYGGDTLFRVKGSGAVAYYRFDEDVRDWTVYNKQVEASGWAGFVSVSAGPDICRLNVNHTPAATPVPLESYTPNSVMQASDGKLEFAYTDNIGRLVHGRTDPADINGAQWTVISEQEAFAGRPSLSEHTDGRVVVTAHNTSGSVWQRNQTAKGAAGWGGWIDLAGAMPHHPVTGKTPTGLMTQFALDANGRPWYRIQQRANVDFMGWSQLSGSGFTGPLTAVTVRDGIQLFGRKADGTLATALFKEGGTLSAWASLGAQTVAGTPSVVIYPGYRMRVFATDADGNVVTTGQSVEGGAYEAWETVAGVTAQGSPSAVISPLTGLTEIVVRGTDGYVHNTGETTQGSAVWRTWQQVGYETSATEPTAFTYTSPTGPTWAYTFRTADNQTRIYQVQQTSALSVTRTRADAPSFRGGRLPAPPAE
ncbi:MULTISPECIES: tachylectin-related carbohydrate-binding protein [Streptomyces]|uniref:Tachylectin-related carbohydrate-binding protein n=1 Tax=Streptomyces sudanensis TaxID=436397 RepID=A0ABY4T8U8_9ACTN|nr:MULTISPECIES: tachylectin-related carbohydrate-binding protein [Streptomyces]URN14816.1 tachylectin-related carbohydrate-binding protein [Streptomyces sudanensis]